MLLEILLVGIAFGLFACMGIAIVERHIVRCGGYCEGITLKTVAAATVVLSALAGINHIIFAILVLCNGCASHYSPLAISLWLFGIELGFWVGLGIKTLKHWWGRAHK